MYNLNEEIHFFILILVYKTNIKNNDINKR